MTDNNGVVSRRPSEDAAVADMVLDVADDSSFRNGSKRQHIADNEGGLLAAVDELAGVETLGGDEELVLLLVAERVAEGDLSERRATARIVDDVSDDTLQVAVALSEIQAPEAGRALAVVRVGLEDRACSLTLRTDHTSHCDDDEEECLTYLGSGMGILGFFRVGKRRIYRRTYSTESIRAGPSPISFSMVLCYLNSHLLQKQKVTKIIRVMIHSYTNSLLF